MKLTKIQANAAKTGAQCFARRPGEPVDCGREVYLPAALSLSAFATTLAVVKPCAVPVFSGMKTRRFKKTTYCSKSGNRVSLSESAKLLCKSIDYIGFPERLEANYSREYAHPVLPQKSGQSWRRTDQLPRITPDEE